MSRKKSFLKSWIVAITALISLVFIMGVLYAAYVHLPDEDRDCRSSYLEGVATAFVETDSFRIHYLHEGTGEPVILIHGASTWLYSYRDNLPVLAERFSVYAPDMPGHGYTLTLERRPAYDLDMMSRAIGAFMDGLGLERASFVGHSSGGSWVIHFAAQHPERVERLVLIDSNGLDVPLKLTFKLLSYPLIGELFSKFFTTDDVKKGLEDAFFDRALVTEEMIREIKTPLTFLNNRPAQYLCIRNQDWKVTEREMATLDVPVLVIWGEDDRYLDCAMAGRFRDILPDATVVTLARCGHSAHEERPDEVNCLVCDFLGDTVRQ